jgi:predicted phosphodiesterase
MQPSNLGNKQYSFGLVSDLHITASTSVAWKPTVKFDNALTYFENQGCAFCVVCGDLTQTGFYRRTNESDASTTYLDETQFANYKGICDKHTVPVYALMGNHESIYGIPISNNLDLVETYTGKGALSYVLEQANDLLILLGQPNYNKVMSDEDFEWFKNLLVSNQDKRCFVFVHSYIEEDSGDARDFRENSVFEDWGVTKTDAFKNLIKQYPNVILFHGHSHIKFECQSLDKSANYTSKNGFKSVHIPSLGRPRNINLESAETPYADSEAQGYIVDVYNNCIVLNGMDLINNKPIPIAQYCLDTTLQTIAPNTYTDTTGTITT